MIAYDNKDNSLENNLFDIIRQLSLKAIICRKKSAYTKLSAGSAIYASLGVLQTEEVEFQKKDCEKLLPEAKMNLEKWLPKFCELKSRKVLFERYQELDKKAEKTLQKLSD